jgi:outer membrane protein assembly factor BamD
MNRSSVIRVTVSLAMLGLAAGCANNSRQEELAYVERAVEVIYAEAIDSLERQNWELAGAQFDEVQRQHPYSVWAQRSMLMAAYVRYRARDYDEAISSAQQYIALHPGAEGAPYAYYLVAVAHFDQIIDVGREQARSVLAEAALREVVARFPQSEYARDAALKLDMVKDQLAGKEMEIGRYYLRRNEHLAAINRFRTVVKTYDTTTHAPEALHRLVEAYLSIGLEGQAQAAAAVLGFNYPGSEWYADTYTLMTGRGVELPVRPQSDGDAWYQRMWNAVF